MPMRAVLAATLLLAACFLLGRMLWFSASPAVLPAAAAKQSVVTEPIPVATDSGAQGAQPAWQLFRHGSAPQPGSPASLPVLAADISHVREFAFDTAPLHRLASGDRIRIDFPPLGGRYELSVDEVVENPDGRTIRGHIDYDRREYPGLITLTSNWSFGSFTTPEGNFEFTARDGRARMVDGAELERRAYVSKHTLIPKRS